MPPKNIPPAKNEATSKRSISIPVKKTSSRTKTAEALKPSTTKTSPTASTASKSGKTTSTTVKKTASNSKVLAKTAASDKLKKKEWTSQDEAARKIQTKIRQFFAKRSLEKKKREKEEYHELMDKLEREAFVHMVKMQQKDEDKRREKENADRKKRQEDVKRRKRMLDAAYDGDIDVLKEIVREVSDITPGNDVIACSLRSKQVMAIIDCEDANGNTALSEAANGGQADVIRFLLERGADPNSRGAYMRTPLYRAAFAGHLEATQVLLENGADQRIYASDSQNPAEIASTEGVKQILDSWDMAQTNVLLKQIEKAKEQRAEQDRQRKAAETSKFEDVMAEAQKHYEARQKQLNHLYCELNKRITEHDTCVAQGFDRPELTLQSINDAEFEVESMKIQVTKARDELSKARLQLRESAAGEDEDVANELPGLKVMVKELDDVLFRDVGNRILDSGKWPLLIDPTGQAATFLRYRDTNCINALRPADMDNNNIRRCLLGAIRFGKPFVLDMMEVDMFDTCRDRFNEIQPGLMDSIIDKSILKPEKYSKLIKTEDGPDYDKTKFNDLRLSNFKYLLISKNPYPSEKLLESMYIIRVMLPM